MLAIVVYEGRGGTEEKGLRPREKLVQTEKTGSTFLGEISKHGILNYQTLLTRY